MKKFAAVVAYDGSNFHGFQVQPDQRTVQGDIEKALEIIHKQSIQCEGAGRTDTGVHALGQVVSFESYLDRLDPETMKNALNANFPDDMYVRRVYVVKNGFSPRFSARRRIYNYLIDNSIEPNIFRRKYLWWFPYRIDIEKMRNTTRYLLGEKDFTVFRTGRDDRDPIRTINSIRIIRLKHNVLMVRVEGISFLRRMVRNIVGTLIQVGVGSIKPGIVEELIESRDRSKLPYSAPPQGLYFHKVIFDEFES
ncbi:MAG: tRNA pseudouridine(38-40) synthase TruA [Kosmotoga sp.]|nr:MAG: tRNA pseudouridine(38-40) synthase TruA [Kosmotoga sp.]